MGWNYDKIFVEGNIIGVKNVYKNKVFPFSVDEDNVEWLRSCYENEELICKNRHVVDDEVPNSYSTDFYIQYVVRLDENGNVSEKIFDRYKDIIGYPKLNIGTFGKILYFDGEDFKSEDIAFGKFVIVKEGYISYQYGKYDMISTILEFKNDRIGPKIVELYDANFFDECDNANLIWRNPMYESWLKEKEEK